MNKLCILIISFLLLGKFAYPTILEGQNEGYAFKEIVFYTYSDPVTKAKEGLFSIKFDGEGKFRTEVEVTKPTFVFSEFGVYRGEFFIEPGKTIQPVFPTFREKSFAEQKNPFFEPVTFWFKLQGDNGLNQQISSFENLFNQLTDKYFNQLYFKQSQEIYDSVLFFVNKDFTQTGNSVFDGHKNLKLSFLESEVFRQNPEDGAAILSSVPADSWESPAFISYFERIFTNRLSFDAKTEKGAAIHKAIAQTDVGYLSGFVKDKYKLTGDIVKLAIIKMLHDAYYSGTFSQQAILRFLQSGDWQNISGKRITQITQNTVKKLSFLRQGTKAPEICLKDINGNDECTSVNNGKFKYLVFADAEMVVCREHLKYLPKIEGRFQQHLEIVLVMRKTDIIEMKMFLDKNQIPGMQLVDEKGEYIQKYQVKTFPACLLLDENNNIVFGHAKAPLDGFEQQFGMFIRNELFQRQRR